MYVMRLNVSSPGDPDPGPQAEPGFRSRGPGPEEPAAGEGEDVALIGGDQVLKELKWLGKERSGSL